MSLRQSSSIPSPPFLRLSISMYAEHGFEARHYSIPTQLFPESNTRILGLFRVAIVGHVCAGQVSGRRLSECSWSYISTEGAPICFGPKINNHWVALVSNFRYSPVWRFWRTIFFGNIKLRHITRGRICTVDCENRLYEKSETASVGLREGWTRPGCEAKHYCTYRTWVGG